MNNQRPLNLSDPRHERLFLLRQTMKDHGWRACVFTGTDPHESEYPSDHWHNRAFLTGFTGSAGIIAVTHDHAGLWTDGRYYLQAEEELEGSPFHLFREGEPRTLSLTQWLSQALTPGSTIALDAYTCSLTKLRRWRSQTPDSFVWLPTQDPLKELWKERPGLSCFPIWNYQESVLENGERIGIMSRSEKMHLLRELTASQGAQSLLLTALDEVAWALNLRGSDIRYQPVFLAWFYLKGSVGILFVNLKQVDSILIEQLARDGLEIRPYNEIETFLRTLGQEEVLLVSPDSLNVGIFSLLKQRNVGLCEALPSVCSLLKSRKTNRELQLIRRAVEKDGLALVEFLAWFDRHKISPESSYDWTEASLAAKLEHFRQKQSGYQGASFAPIFAFRDKSAMIHYCPLKDGQAIKGHGLLLIDTGGQYFEGTTDITRVVVLGSPTEEQKSDYTLVLKAYIQVAITPFPPGTRGYSIDALARRVLWKKGLDYSHGTGHGIGHFLCVHEGPARLNSDPLPFILEPGMVMSNEPGLYRQGVWGIRLENLQLVTLNQQTGKHFLAWEVLSLCPFSRELIEVRLLDQEERDWLNDYHKMVRVRLWSGLQQETKKWLEEQTTPL